MRPQPDFSCPVCHQTTRLNAVPEGSIGCIRHIDAPPEEADRLKAMGLCVGRNVVVMRASDPMLLKVFGSRLGISASLAQYIWVQYKDPTDCPVLNIETAS